MEYNGFINAFGDSVLHHGEFKAPIWEEMMENSAELQNIM